MAALVEGRKYGLASLQSTSAGKSLIHVKLTDSALKAIEEFQKIKDVTSRRPSIQFQDSNGFIRVPIKKSSDNPEGFRQYGFSLSTLLGDLNGSFDCIQAKHGDLTMLGSMTHKLNVKATDDVYQATGQKMRAAEEESKKSWAKEIKVGSHVSRRVKKVVKRSEVDLPPQPKPTPNPLPKPAPSSAHLSHPSKPAMRPGSLPDRHRDISHRENHRDVKPTHSPQQPLPPTAPAPTSQRPQSTPLIGKSSPNPTIIGLPYKERIMHLLAIRPYKKPELLIRLQKDGIRDKDKNLLGSVLKQVATLSSKDNSFTLNKALYSDLRPDWPGYTDIDKQLLKRRLALLESQPTPASSPGLSPAHSNSSQGSSPGGSHKRPTSTTDEEMLPSLKRARVAHDRKDKEPLSRPKSSPSPGTSPSSLASHTSKASPVSTKSDSPKVTSSTTPDHSTADHGRDRSRSRKEDPALKENHHHNNNHKTQKLPATSTSEIPEYCMKYTSIEGMEQRSKYKTAFNEEYEEYRELHAKVIKVTARFKELEASLRKAEEGTKQYETIKQEIVDEYTAVKRDKTYVEHRRRCDYLHKKLAHIKKLIVDYDNAQMDLS